MPSLSPPVPSLHASSFSNAAVSSSAPEAPIAASATPVSSSFHAAPIPSSSPPSEAQGVLSRVFPTASGAWVRFQAQDGVWQALEASSSRGSSPPRALPVVSPAPIGPQLSWLQDQPARTAKARVHMIPAASSPSGRASVYLGKLGLLGGMPKRNKDGTTWRNGPRLNKDCEGIASDPHQIPKGYQFVDYKVLPGEIVRRAEYSIRYVEADSEEELKQLMSRSASKSGDAHVGVHVDAPVGSLLGEVKGGIMRARKKREEFVQTARYKHAALILSGSTRPNKRFRPRSRLKVITRIKLAKVLEPSNAFSADEHAKALASQREEEVAQVQAMHLERASNKARIRDLEKKLSQLSGDLAAKNSSAHSELLSEIASLKEENASLTATTSHLTSLVESLSMDDASSGSAAETSLSDQPSQSDSSVQLPDSVFLVGPDPVPVENTPTPVSPLATPEDFTSARALHRRLQDTPDLVLTPEQRISLLSMYISDGAHVARSVAGKEVIMVVGRTGVGKSTFLNYLMGCQMVERSRAELRLALGTEDAPDNLLRRAVMVLPVSEGGPRDSVVRIGVTTDSETFIPNVYIDPADPTLAYYDCPGFMDTRGANVNIANAVNIKRIIQSAKCVKVLLLARDTDLDDRGLLFLQLLQMSTQLFGGIDNMLSSRDAILLGLTRVPHNDAQLSTWQDDVRIHKSPVSEMLSDASRLFLYDPLNSGLGDYSSCEDCRARIANLSCLSSPEGFFQTVLTDGDELKLRELADAQSAHLERSLLRGDYAEASRTWQLLYRLKFIDHRAVDRVFYTSRSKLAEFINQRERDYEHACHHPENGNDFTKARQLLTSLESIVAVFTGEDIELDLPDTSKLRTYLSVSKHRASELLELQRHRANYDRVKADHARMQRLLSEMESAHTRQQEELQRDKEEALSILEARIRLLEEGRAARAQELEEAMLLASQNSAEKARLASAMQAMSKNHETELSRLKSESEEAKQRYAKEQALQQQAQAAKEQALKAQLHQAALSPPAQPLYNTSNDSLPSDVFGRQAWKDYFGVDVPAPPAASTAAALSAWENKKPVSYLLEDETTAQRVRENHLLTLIPSTVDGAPFTLDKLGELIRRNHGGRMAAFRDNFENDTGAKAHGFHWYSEYIPNRVRTKRLSGTSYWLLFPKTILADSRSKHRAGHEAQVQKECGSSYRMPHVLEAATSLLAHYAVHYAPGKRPEAQKRLYANENSKGWWTYTRCEETAKEGYGLFVGGFGPAGLDVYYIYSDDGNDGVSCCREF